MSDEASGADWAAVVAADFAVPPGRELESLVGELESRLRSPDPRARDEQAYLILASWIRRGVLNERLASLGDRMTEALRHKEIQARTFACSSSPAPRTCWTSSGSRRASNPKSCGACCPWVPSA